MNITRILAKIQDYFNGKVNTILMPFQPAITCLYSLSSCSCSPENHTKGVSSIRKRELLKERQLLHKSRVYCQHISSMAPEFKSERKEGILSSVCKTIQSHKWRKKYGHDHSFTLTTEYVSRICIFDETDEISSISMKEKSDDGRVFHV